MAERTEQQLLQDIADFVTTNGNKEISALDVRTVLINIVQSSLNSQDDVSKLGLFQLNTSRVYGAGETFVYGDNIYRSDIGHLPGMNPDDPDGASFTNLGEANESFNGDRVITRPGDFYGINVGTSTLRAFIESVFFIPEAPLVTLGGGAVLEFGSSLTRTLAYEVIKRTSGIDTLQITSVGQAAININIGAAIGNDETVSGTSQEGTQEVNLDALPSPTTTLSLVRTYTLTAVDSQARTHSNSTSFTFRLRRFWGILDDNGLDPGDGQVIYNTLQDIIDNPPVDAKLRGLSSELATNLIKTYTNIDGQNNFLVFHWPTLMGNPSFIVGGLENTDFTKVRSAVSFTNDLGYSQPYDTWVTNTKYISPITINVQNG